VVNAINNHRNAAPPAQTLVEYFSSPPPVFPLTDRYYKYNVGDKVRVDLTPSQRQTLGFKYSMYYGMAQMLGSRGMVWRLKSQSKNPSL
jgi:hypothetical protein